MLWRFFRKDRFYYGLKGDGKTIIDLLYKKMGKEDGWIFGLPSNEEDDKFPYLRFGEYLRQRGHGIIADEMVVWSDKIHPTPQKVPPPGEKIDPEILKPQRSKIIINSYKQKIRNDKDKNDASFLESFEAHIRLLSGTWKIAKTFKWWALASGLVMIAVVGFVKAGVVDFQGLRYHVNIFLLAGIIELFAAAILFKTQIWIEDEFHYQRLRELTRILTSAYVSRKKEPVL